MIQGTASRCVDILVVGLSKTGTSSFLRTISQRLASSQGWISGHVSMNYGLDVNLIAPPLPTNLEFAWLKDVVNHARANGFIVLCDSTQTESFMEVIYLLHTIRAYHPKTPVVLVASQQDHPMAWSTRLIRTRLGISSDILIMPYISRDRDAAEVIIHELVRQVLSQ